MDTAPIPAAQAQEAGLIDHVGYRDAVREAVDRHWPEKPALLYVSRYERRWDNVRRAIQSRRPAVGLVEAIGPIRLGRSKPGPVGRAAGSDTVAAAFRAAVKNESIKAIVFRVNSPGGSYVASDTIWREVWRAREASKPVVVSMGDVAGSGGYFVAMAADVIVAEPATLTGSIGVFGGKLRTSGLFERLGVNIETLGLGQHALMFSSQTGFSENEWAKLDEWLDFVYEDFTAKVARGRSMTREAVHELARGRVWTGADAAARARRRARRIAPCRGDRPGTLRPATRRPPASGRRRFARATPAPTPQQRRPGGLPAGPGTRSGAVRMGRPRPAGGGAGVSGRGPADNADGAAPLGRSSGHSLGAPLHDRTDVILSAALRSRFLS